MSAPSTQEALWKQRYEALKSDIEDLVSITAEQKFEKCPKRAWDAAPEVFISFCFDVVDSEEKAIELFGKRKYDVYKLVRTGDDPYEQK